MLKPTRVVNYLTMKGVAQEIYIRRMAETTVVKGRDMAACAESEALFALSAAESFTAAFNKRCALEASGV